MARFPYLRMWFSLLVNDMGPVPKEARWMGPSLAPGAEAKDLDKVTSHRWTFQGAKCEAEVADALEMTFELFQVRSSWQRASDTTCCCMKMPRQSELHARQGKSICYFILSGAWLVLVLLASRSNSYRVCQQVSFGDPKEHPSGPGARGLLLCPGSPVLTGRRSASSQPSGSVAMPRFALSLSEAFFGRLPGARLS